MISADYCLVFSGFTESFDTGKPGNLYVREHRDMAGCVVKVRFGRDFIEAGLLSVNFLVPEVFHAFDP